MIHVLWALLFLQSSRALSVPPAQLLQEPGYFLEHADGLWTVKKPRFRLGGSAQEGSRAWSIFESGDRRAAERRMIALPRLRWNGPLVRFNPLTRERNLVEDWTGQNDAMEVESDVRALLRRNAPAPALALFSSTPVYMAQLSGASGHTAEEQDHARKYVIYLDPFRATGRLHAASTLVHEIAHVERYRDRGFHANRAAAVLPKADFVLLGLEDELAACRAEAAFLGSALKGILSPGELAAAKEMMRAPELRWPAALLSLLNSQAPEEIREQIAIDLRAPASRYWDLHHKDSLDFELEAAIRDWYSHSPEWKEIERRRPVWLAGGLEAKPQ